MNKPATAKITLRILGTLTGLLGVLAFCAALYFLYVYLTGREAFLSVTIIFLLFGLAVYFQYVAYLVWFKFSPLAVKHICGVAGFYILGETMKFLAPANAKTQPAPWTFFAFLACLVVVCLAYRIASSRLNRLLFPENLPRTS